MTEYIIAGIAGGVLFGILDGLINANPYAQKLFEIYKPIARKVMNIPAGIIIDLAYGFAMAGLFLLLYNSLPGEAGIVKGISFAFIAWFFRVVMYGVSHWMMFKVPIKTVFYILITGLAEMLVLGILYGLLLRPFM